MILKPRHAILVVSSLLVFSVAAVAQSFTWTPISADLPPSIKVFSGTASGPISAFYAEVDWRDTLVGVLALKSATSAGKEGVSSFASKVNAYVAINGGFFGGTPASSYSLVVSGGRLLSRQLASVSRTSGSYPLMRANFGVLKDRTLQTAWIYHFDNEVTGIYRFTSPLPHTQSAPAPAPVQQDGAVWSNLQEAIGGGPNLVSNGQVNVTYDQEVMFGSGVGLDNGDPRTAVGYTADRRVILFVVDGRGASIGMSLPQVAQTMINLGCIEAINLDGGGSSTFFAGGAVRNTPSDGTERQVSSALAIVPLPSYDRTMDTDDPGYSEVGTNWLTALNEGYFGSQKTRITQSGTGDRSAVFRFRVPAEATYEVFAWWTAFASRATNTPHIVYSKGRVDTVRVNQADALMGSKWNSLGSFVFSGAGEDSVVITNEASGMTNPSFIAVDGLRIVTYDRSLLVDVPNRQPVPERFRVLQNFPNPFNPSVTTIRFVLPKAGNITLTVFDLLGREIAELTSGFYGAGEHLVKWSADGLSSAAYLCRLRSGQDVQWTKMLLVR